MKVKLSTLLFLLIQLVQSQVITTLAGDSVYGGYNGDGIPAINAKLNYPYGLAVEANGVVYIADTYNHRIRKIDTLGIISTVAGNGTAGFSGDGGLAIN